MVEGTENTPKATERVEIPASIRQLASAMEGLPGANEIVNNLGTAAVKEGLIKVVPVEEGNELTKNPETIKPSEIPLMRSEEKKGDEGKDKPAPAAKAEEKKVASTEEDQNKNTQNNSDEEDEDDDPNPIIQSIKGNAKKNDTKFENFDGIKDHVKKHFGIEIKSEKEFGKFFKSTEKWREDAAKVPEMTQKLEQFETIFNDMPAPLLDGIKAYFDGNSNWADEISKAPKFNFNKSAEDHSTKELVKHYFPNKFKDEDFTAEEKSPALEIAIQASIDKFNVDKREIEQLSAKQIKDSQARTETRKNSIAGSLTSLKQSFPEIDKAEEKRLSKILESGDIHSLFFNKDGSYKPDAAKRLFLAEYGEGAIVKLMKVSAKRAESKTNEEILSRGADSPKPEKGGASNNEVDAKVKKEIESLTGGLNKKLTY